MPSDARSRQADQVSGAVGALNALCRRILYAAQRKIRDFRAAADTVYAKCAMFTAPANLLFSHLRWLHLLPPEEQATSGTRCAVLSERQHPSASSDIKAAPMDPAGKRFVTVATSAPPTTPLVQRDPLRPPWPHALANPRARGGALGIIVAWTSMPLLVVLAGCAFDLVQVKQFPTTFTPAAGPGPKLELAGAVKAYLGTSYPTLLKPGTQWVQVGTTDQGDVYSTRDQIVAVEASHMHEADIVVSNSLLTGFLLKAERTFSPVTRPVALHFVTPSTPQLPTP